MQTVAAEGAPLSNGVTGERTELLLRFFVREPLSLTSQHTGRLGTRTKQGTLLLAWFSSVLYAACSLRRRSLSKIAW